jgi:hypothetical protein
VGDGSPLAAGYKRRFVGMISQEKEEVHTVSVESTSFPFLKTRRPLSFTPEDEEPSSNSLPASDGNRNGKYEASCAISFLPPIC